MWARIGIVAFDLTTPGDKVYDHCYFTDEEVKAHSY